MSKEDKPTLTCYITVFAITFSDINYKLNQSLEGHKSPNPLSHFSTKHADPHY